MTSRAVAASFALLSSLLVVSARAQSLEEPTLETDRLEAQLDSELKGLDALVSQDCSAACAALESMERAARRLCELDPGPRCTAAEKTVEEARRRLRAACPECQPAGDGAPKLQRDDGVTTQKSPVIAPAEEAEATSPGADAPAPPAAETTGGCAGCAIAGSGDHERAPFLLLLVGAAAIGRRRRHSKR